MKNAPFRQIPASGSNFNPRNTQCIPACPTCPVAPADGTGVGPADRTGVVKILAFLGLEPRLNIKYGFNWAGKIGRFAKVSCSYVHSDYPDCHHAVDLFFSALSAEKKTYFLSANSASRANLPEADKAGGEKHSLTYLHSKVGTISIAEGLKALIKRKYDGKNTAAERETCRFFRYKLTCGNPSRAHLPVSGYEFTA